MENSDPYDGIFHGDNIVLMGKDKRRKLIRLEFISNVSEIGRVLNKATGKTRYYAYRITTVDGTTHDIYNTNEWDEFYNLLSSVDLGDEDTEEDDDEDDDYDSDDSFIDNRTTEEIMAEAAQAQDGEDDDEEQGG